MPKILLVRFFSGHGVYDRRGRTLFTLSSVDTSVCLFHAGANGRMGYDTLTHSRLYSRDREKK